MPAPKTLKEALRIGRRKAYADVAGFADPFAAIDKSTLSWMRTLPKEWQKDVESAIVEVYHNT